MLSRISMKFFGPAALKRFCTILTLIHLCFSHSQPLEVYTAFFGVKLFFKYLSWTSVRLRYYILLDKYISIS